MSDFEGACTHREIHSWRAETQDEHSLGEALAFWSCVECGRKFAPVVLTRDLDTERDREARADLAAENERLRTIETAASILVGMVRTVMPETAVCSHDREWLLSVLDDLIVALADPRGGRA